MDATLAPDAMAALASLWEPVPQATCTTCGQSIDIRAADIREHEYTLCPGCYWKHELPIGWSDAEYLLNLHGRRKGSQACGWEDEG